jgi:hypothetical protein
MPLRRLVLTRKDPSAKAPLTPVEIQERYAVNLIRENPHFQLIKASLKEGISAAEISRHFAENSWITVSERTFSDALRTFRRKYPREIDNTDIGYVDEHIPANAPVVDELIHLQQLLRLQKVRIGLDFKHEKEMGKLFATTGKEIEVAGKLVETMAKVRGKIHDGSPSKYQPHFSQNVTDNLVNIKKDEGTRDRLHELTRQLVTDN